MLLGDTSFDVDIVGVVSVNAFITAKILSCFLFRIHCECSQTSFIIISKRNLELCNY